MKLLELAQKIACGLDASKEDIASVNDNLSGFEALIGLRYEVLSCDHVVATLNVTEDHLQPWGVVHGGVHAAVAESVGSMLSVLAMGGVVVGIENHTQFFHPATNGEIIYEAFPIHVGKTVQAIQIRAFDRRDPNRLISQTQLRTVARN
ncbi:MAG: PaaI family thioesterase [Corynebacterium sp.]|nr:PaaI family thioesterase [Corynebacterium sp.]